MVKRNNIKDKFLVAYFSMEIAVISDLKTYAGGLGVLAGDILKSASSLSFPMVGVTLLNRQGYFKQTIAPGGEQIVQPEAGDILKKLKKLAPQVSVRIGKDEVTVGVWRYLIKARAGIEVPVYFLDTDYPNNSPANRQLTGQLYGGDQEYRLKQEIILGRAGVKILQALGYKKINKFHLNEGHGALAAVELFLQSRQKNDSDKVEEVRRLCVFTTHTPIQKEQDIFSLSYFLQYQADFPLNLKNLLDNKAVNMTKLALYFSAYSNAVSRRHQAATRKMFPAYKISAITNGVNSLAWTAPEFKKLYDKYIPGWRQYGPLILNASKIPLEEIKAAHRREKKRLINYINKITQGNFREDVFTLVFARRFTPYKRPEFLLQNVDKLAAISKTSGKIQIIYAGKAHPHDVEGQALIKYIEQVKKDLAGQIKIVFLEDYDLNKAHLLVAGADLWLNTPLPPNEASGTSGMKAAHNGVPQLSTADGWWPEGYVKNKTGWMIREKAGAPGGAPGSVKSDIYETLSKEILPLYYQAEEKWLEIERSTISSNASYFNTDRVLLQYIKEAYGL